MSDLVLSLKNSLKINVRHVKSRFLIYLIFSSQLKAVNRSGINKTADNLQRSKLRKRIKEETPKPKVKQTVSLAVPNHAVKGGPILRAAGLHSIKQKKVQIKKQESSTALSNKTFMVKTENKFSANQKLEYQTLDHLNTADGAQDVPKKINQEIPSSQFYSARANIQPNSTAIQQTEIKQELQSVIRTPLRNLQSPERKRMKLPLSPPIPIGCGEPKENEKPIENKIYMTKKHRILGTVYKMSPKVPPKPLIMDKMHTETSVSQANNQATEENKVTVFQAPKITEAPPHDKPLKKDPKLDKCFY